MSTRTSSVIIKPSLTLLILTCSLLCQASISFYAKYQNIRLDPSIASSWNISLYKDGVRLNHESFYNKIDVTFFVDEGSYTYHTDLNHKGMVNNGDIIRLKTGLFKYSLYDSEGKPISGVTVEIYEDGDRVKSISTNEEGIAECYLAESNKYAYKAGNSSGSFAIAADEETHIDDSNRRVSVMLKYQDIPAQGTYYLVGNDGTESSSAYIYTYSTSGKLTFSCKHGKTYRIRNRYDVYSEPFTPTAYNNSFVLEHRKVTFVSGSDDPNILYDFNILGANQSSNFGEKKVSDGKGYVVYYLLPGKYKYSHLGSIVPFEVADKDITLTLTTNPKTIRLKDASGNGIPGQKIKIIDNKGGESQEYVSNDLGTVIFKSISDGCYAQVNGYGQFPLGTSASLDIQLTELVFDSPVFDNASLIQLTDGKNTLIVKQGSHIWVPTDNYYTYSASIGGQWLYGEINPTEGSVAVGDNLNAVTFMAEEKGGMPLSGFKLYVQNGNTTSAICTTDAEGQCTVYLKDGFYEFKNQSMQMQTIEALYIDSDKTIRYSAPNEIAIIVNVDGQPWNGYVSLTNENGENVSMTCSQGIGKARLSENERYAVAIGSMTHTCKVNVTNGMTLDFYETRVVPEGDGLAFPIVSYYYENTQTKMLGGENLHLVAVPAANSSFKHWLINGEIYESSVVDYKVSATIDAVAVFEPSEHSIIESVSVSKGSFDITVKDDYLIFNRYICGNVDLYSSSGVKVRSSYVVSDKMDISDLATGVYIIVLTEESSQYSSKFMKK